MLHNSVPAARFSWVQSEIGAGEHFFNIPLSGGWDGDPDADQNTAVLVLTGVDAIALLMRLAT